MQEVIKIVVNETGQARLKTPLSPLKTLNILTSVVAGMVGELVRQDSSILPANPPSIPNVLGNGPTL
jgi:hypothetical protein